MTIRSPKVTWIFPQRERNLSALRNVGMFGEKAAATNYMRIFESKPRRQGEIYNCERCVIVAREKSARRSHRGNACAKSETIPAERFLLTKAFRFSQKRPHLTANSCISRLSVAVSLSRIVEHDVARGIDDVRGPNPVFGDASSRRNVQTNFATFGSRPALVRADRLYGSATRWRDCVDDLKPIKSCPQLPVTFSPKSIFPLSMDRCRCWTSSHEAREIGTRVWRNCISEKTNVAQ